MMLFKFDIKYVKLNFKAIASMVFNFDLKLNLLCLYDGSLFMKTIENCLVKILENSSSTSFDQSSEAVTNLFDSIDIQLLVDRLNFSFLIDQAAIEYQSSQADCQV